MRPLSSRVSSFKSYLSQARNQVVQSRANAVNPDGSTPTWGQWAGQKLKNMAGRGEGQSGVEKLFIFPGWAARSYHEIKPGDEKCQGV
jgi:hypothetical protein